MKPVRVRLGERSYNLHIGSHNPGFFRQLKKAVPDASTVLVVTSAALKRTGHLARFLRAAKRQRWAVSAEVLPDGEQHKTIATIERLARAAVTKGLDRRSVVVALGGGVITDMAGFFAATYMRGIRYVSIPTTLLGMVDASIGGKTGVDLAEGKNLVGSFWQPRMVWIDPQFLKTLPVKELVTGFAEIIKYGVIKDARFFDWLEKRWTANSRLEDWPAADVARAIYVSAHIKAAVVSGDERERPLGGGREILNFGHTVGHALEAAFAYKSLSHGKSISIGMLVAGQLALFHGFWSENSQSRLKQLLQRVGLPTEFPALNNSRRRIFWSALGSDKKNISGRLRFVLPLKIGRVKVKSGIDPALVKRAISSLRGTQSRSKSKIGF